MSKLEEAQNRGYELYDVTEHVNRLVAEARAALDVGDVTSALEWYTQAADRAERIAGRLRDATEAAKDAAE